ncbi:unnamed protein product [Onchocerca ochengi]|uniref:Retrotransposon protein n=1 Tax=Onchocerca ochengi TaxID=42157 RepID=A0A182EK10_ONCOC|nr:unnamed protein product [Onchocerca ochengi]
MNWYEMFGVKKKYMREMMKIKGVNRGAPKVYVMCPRDGTIGGYQPSLTIGDDRGSSGSDGGGGVGGAVRQHRGSIAASQIVTVVASSRLMTAAVHRHHCCTPGK